MKKNINRCLKNSLIGVFVLAFLLFAHSTLAASWTAIGNNIYYNAGRVSIGQTVPFTALDIQDATNTLAHIENKAYYPLFIHHLTSANGEGTGIGFSITTSDDTVDGAFIYKRTGSNGQGEMQFYTKPIGAAAIAPTQAMVITDKQNLLIGTSTDGNYRLYVKGDVNIKGDLYINGIKISTSASSGGSATTTSNYSTSTCPHFSGSWDIDQITVCSRIGNNLTMTTYYIPFFDLFFIICIIFLVFLIIFRRKKNAN